MSNRTRPRPAARQRPESSSRGLPPWLPFLILGAVAVVILIGVVAASQSDGDAGDSLAFGDVAYVGDPLPDQVAPGAVDDAIGMTAPVLRGFDPDSVEQRFENGAPRVVFYLAHWCSHCQEELDAINAWLDAGNSFPEGVEIQTVATWTDAARPNFPPGEWLADNRWDHPTIVDDEAFTLAEQSGLQGTPMIIFVGADGTIVDRSGSITPDDLAARMQALLDDSGSDGEGSNQG